MIVTTLEKERKINWILDIEHWTFEYSMSQIEYPAYFTLILKSAKNENDLTYDQNDSRNPVVLFLYGLFYKVTLRKDNLKCI